MRLSMNFYCPVEAYFLPTVSIAQGPPHEIDRHPPHEKIPPVSGRDLLYVCQLPQ